MTDKKKTLPLTANVPVVKSPKLPAVKGKGAYHEFDDYREAARILGERLDERDLGDVAHWYAEFARGREAFERDELYRKLKKHRPDLLNCWREYEITRRVVTEKVGLLLASFPNASPGNGEAYMGMLIEEIIAANPRASALEAACRALRRTKNFAPTIAEMFKELLAQAEMFDKVLGFWEEDCEWAVKEHARHLAAHEARIKREADEKRQEEERWARAREARDRERKEAEERARAERLERERQEQQKLDDALAQSDRRIQAVAERWSLWFIFQIMLMSRGIFIPDDVLPRLLSEGRKAEIIKRSNGKWTDDHEIHH